MAIKWKVEVLAVLKPSGKPDKTSYSMRAHPINTGKYDCRTRSKRDGGNGDHARPTRDG